MTVIPTLAERADELEPHLAAIPPRELDWLSLGPYEEPYCMVCSALIPIADSGSRPARRGAVAVLNYHRRPRGIEPLEDIALSDVEIWLRCWAIYLAAARLVDRPIGAGRYKGRRGRLARLAGSPVVRGTP